MTFWQNRNICSIQLQKMMTLSKIIPISRSVGLEPTLPEGIWFLVRRLNHSAMTAYIHYHFYWNKYETCLKHSPTPSPIYNFSELKFKDQQNFLKTFLKHVSDISNSGAARAPKVRGVRMPNLPPIFRKFTFYCIFMWQFFGFSKVRGVSWPLWPPIYVKMQMTVFETLLMYDKNSHHACQLLFHGQYEWHKEWYSKSGIHIQNCSCSLGLFFINVFFSISDLAKIPEKYYIRT